MTDPRCTRAVRRHCSSEKESQRIDCLRHERDRTLALLARGMVRTVLASYLGCPCGDLQFAANDFGKPILTGHVRRCDSI